MPSLAELRKQRIEASKKTPEKKIIPDSQDQKITPGEKEIKISISKKESKTITEDIEKLTIDELRAYYIVICKKKPKHDSKQDKQYLVNEIIKVLNLSKK